MYKNHTLHSMSTFGKDDMKDNIFKESCQPIDYTKINKTKAPKPPVQKQTYHGCVMSCVPPAEHVKGI